MGMASYISRDRRLVMLNRITRVRNPAGKVMLAEEKGGQGDGPGEAVIDDGRWTPPGYPLTSRHGGRANVTFADGRVENVHLLERKRKDRRNIPPAYDACWDTGISLHYDRGMLESALAITHGTLSNPTAYDNDGYQGIITLGLQPAFGLRFGGSMAYGAWIAPSGTETENGNYATSGAAVTSLGDFGKTVSDQHGGPYPGSVEDHQAMALGGYGEYSFGYWRFYSEVIWEQWEMPFLNEDTIDLLSGYVEAQYKLTPQWYLAARVDRLQYSEIMNPETGLKEGWGYDINRLELALSYRIIREGFIRLDYQANRYDDWSSHDEDILALQFLFAF
jgi:prepilin-type processing-associated H-X9-DG protein